MGCACTAPLIVFITKYSFVASALRLPMNGEAFALSTFSLLFFLWFAFQNVSLHRFFERKRSARGSVFWLTIHGVFFSSFGKKICLLFW